MAMPYSRLQPTTTRLYPLLIKYQLHFIHIHILLCIFSIFIRTNKNTSWISSFRSLSLFNFCLTLEWLNGCSSLKVKQAFLFVVRMTACIYVMCIFGMKVAVRRSRVDRAETSQAVFHNHTNGLFSVFPTKSIHQPLQFVPLLMFINLYSMNSAEYGTWWQPRLTKLFCEVIELSPALLITNISHYSQEWMTSKIEITPASHCWSARSMPFWNVILFLLRKHFSVPRPMPKNWCENIAFLVCSFASQFQVLLCVT